MKRFLHHLHRGVILLTAATLIVAVLTIAPAMAKAKHPKNPAAAVCKNALDSADEMERGSAGVFTTVSTLLGSIGTNASTNDTDTTAFISQLTTDLNTFNTTIAGQKDQVISSIQAYRMARTECLYTLTH